MTYFEKPESHESDDLIAFGEDIGLALEQFLDNKNTPVEVSKGNSPYTRYGRKYTLIDSELDIARTVLAEHGLTVPDSMALTMVTKCSDNHIWQTTLLSTKEVVRSEYAFSELPTAIGSNYFIESHIRADSATTTVTKSIDVDGGDLFSDSISAFQSRPDDFSLEDKRLNVDNPAINAFFRGVEISKQMEVLGASEPSNSEQQALLEIIYKLCEQSATN